LNRSRDLLSCSAVSQPTAPPAACQLASAHTENNFMVHTILLSILTPTLIVMMYVDTCRAKHVYISCAPLEDPEDGQELRH
jgi:hypothetical protein